MNWNQNSEPLSTTEPVVRNDRENVRMANSIVAQVSSNITRLNEATQHFIVLAADPGCGLARDSALVATNLLTMQQSDSPRVLGSLSAVTTTRVGDCPRVAFGLT
jgi:mRNA interferase MazF